MIEIILPLGRGRIRGEPAAETAAEAIRTITKRFKLEGSYRLRSAEGVLRGNKKLASLASGTALKLEPKP